MKTPTTREQADELLKRKCEISIDLKKIEARMNSAIQTAKDAATVRATPYQEESAQIDAALEQWFLSERPKLGKRRSLTLTFGRVGMRAQTAVEFIRGWTEDKVIAALEAAGLKEFVRYKKGLNRQACRDADGYVAHNLRDFGVRVESGDTFFVEPDLDALADHSEVKAS